MYLTNFLCFFQNCWSLRSQRCNGHITSWTRWIWSFWRMIISLDWADFGSQELRHRIAKKPCSWATASQQWAFSVLSWAFCSNFTTITFSWIWVYRLLFTLYAETHKSCFSSTALQISCSILRSLWGFSCWDPKSKGSNASTTKRRYFGI